MVVSTIYDADLRAKVFEIRGSERYVNSTITALTMTYNNNRKDYVTVTFSALVSGHLGSSNVAFYCDDELMGTKSCVKTQGSSRVTFSAKVSYGYHKYYAKYLGNTQCLSSKSRIVELSVTEQNIPSTNISLNIVGLDSNSWINRMDNLTGTVVLTDENSNVLNKPVKIYFDENYSTITTTGETNITSLFPQYGSYIGGITMKAVFEGDNGYLGCESAPIQIYAGYDFAATSRYAKIGVGDKAVFDVHLSKPDGTPVPDKTVTLRRV